MSSDFNQFVRLEHGQPVIDLEEAYIMYVAETAPARNCSSPRPVQKSFLLLWLRRRVGPGSGLRAMLKAQRSCTGHGSIEIRLGPRAEAE
jgi:hypothetical protein